MKKNKFSSFAFCCLFCSWSVSFCQSSNDSLLLAHSEKWEVKQNEGLFGLAKPAFGSYVTLEVKKIDSPVVKKKTKDSSYSGIEISREGTDFDFGEIMTIQKKKFYKLRLSDTSDTIESLFAISSLSHKKKKSLLGTLLSKNDEGTGATVLDYNRNVQGIITTDSIVWQFFIENFTSGARQTETQFAPVASISGGYLKTQTDSLFMQTYSLFGADIVLVNRTGEHLAAVAFRQKPPVIWISNNINSSYQKAIAALFAVIIAFKNYN